MAFQGYLLLWLLVSACCSLNNAMGDQYIKQMAPSDALLLKERRLGALTITGAAPGASLLHFPLTNSLHFICWLFNRRIGGGGGAPPTQQRNKVWAPCCMFGLCCCHRGKSQVTEQVRTKWKGGVEISLTTLYFQKSTSQEWGKQINWAEGFYNFLLNFNVSKWSDLFIF